MVDCGGLLSRCTGSNLYQGFESLPLRFAPAPARVVAPRALPVPMMHRLEIHPAHRFACTQCGKCCRDWTISFSDDEKQDLEKQDWGAHFPELTGRTLWEPNPGGRGALKWRMKLGENGACPFLDPQNRCRIHSKFGGRAKPLVCRAFPITFADTPEGTFVGSSFNCPGAVHADGPLVAGDPKDLVTLHQDLHRIAAIPPYPETVAVGGGNLTWTDVQRIQVSLQDLLADVSLPLPKRLLACLRVADILSAVRMETPAEDRLKQILEIMVPVLRELERAAALDRPALGFAERVLFRQLLGMFYLREYIPYRRLPFAQRLRATATGYRFLFQRGTVTATGMPAPVALAAVRRVGGPALEPEVSALWERYLRTKLWGQGIFSHLGFQLSFVHGIGLLGVAYAAISWWARASASARGAPTAVLEDLERGMQYVDYTFAGMRTIGPYYQIVLQSLTTPATAARLVRWFGDPTPPEGRA